MSPRRRSEIVGRLGPPAFALAATALSLALRGRTFSYAGPHDQAGFNRFAFAGIWSYSDIASLYFRDRGWRHPVPYFDYPFEYPAVTGAFVWVAGLAHRTVGAYMAASGVLLGGCAAAVATLMRLIPRANPWLFALAPTLVLYAVFNWDLLAIALTAAALAAAMARRSALSGSMLALAVWAKLFPAVFLPLLLLAAARRGRREPILTAAAFAAVSALVNLPVLLSGGFARFVTLNAQRRGLSIWSLAPFHLSIAQLNLTSALLAAAGCALILAAVWRAVWTDAPAMVPAGLALLAWLFAVSKVYSPQYSLWVVALLAMCGAPIALVVAIGVFDVAFYAADFTSLFLASRGDRAHDVFHANVVHPAVAVRELLLLAACGFAVWLARRRATRHIVPRMAGRGALAGCAAAMAVAALSISAERAEATPTCPGADRTLCGGRIIPEPSQTLGFLTYNEWSGAMRELAKEHPDRVRFRQIGKTAAGRPLYDVMVSDFADSTPLSRRTGLYFNGDIHGDERDGTEGFARAIEDLATAKDRATVDKLRREVLVFTDANPDGWQPGDVPDGGGGQYSRQNGAGHDLNREWPVVGFQNPDTFPSVDPEVRSIVAAHGNGLHRRDGIDFAYGIDVHGSAGAETPPNAQLMLDVLLSADQLDLTRAMEQAQMADTYMSNLSATTNDNVLATIGSASGSRVYRVGDWDTSWDIYGYLVSGGYADWQANSVTGLGAVTGTVELWINGEPGQYNTFTGYNQEIEASNVHSVRVAVATLMSLGMRRQQGNLHLPGPVGWVPSGFALKPGQGKGPSAPVGDPATRPPIRTAPATPDRFWQDLAKRSDQPITDVDPLAADLPRVLAQKRAVVLTGNPQTSEPGFLAALKRYAQNGGTVVLTDGALQALSALGIVPANAVAKQDVYAGYFDTTDPSSPLVRGRRPLSRQTYEPVPIGYAIDNTFSSTLSTVHSPAWTVDSNAWQAAGGKTVGTTGSGRTSLGELPLGKGRIRILGVLLPNPSGDYAHPFGVDDYAVTYWGYRVVANLLDGSEALGPPAPCVDRRKFSFRIHQPRRGRVTVVAVYVNGKRVRRVHRHRVKRVTLAKLPQGTFTVKIVARTSGGSKTVSVRRYRGCVKEPPHTHVRRKHHHKKKHKG